MSIVRHEMGPRFSEMTVTRIGESNLIVLSAQVAENTSLGMEGQTAEILRFVDRLLAQVGADKRQEVAPSRVYHGVLRRRES